MKAFHYILIIVLIIVFAEKSVAQYPILKTERVYTPWDLDTTIKGQYADISLSQEAKLIILYVPYPTYLPTFYFYDESNKSWSKKELTDEKWKIDSFYKDYTFDFKTILGYEQKNIATKEQSLKWIFNYGDSLLTDVIRSTTELFTSYIVTPSLTFISEVERAPEFTYDNYTYKPFNTTLFKRTNIDGGISTEPILKLEGGHKSVSGNQQFQNYMSVVPIDDETVVVGVDRQYWSVPMNGNYTKEVYTLLIDSKGQTRISDTITLPRKNSDKQFFLKRDPSTTYLYSSPRHGISSGKPVNFDFIDEHLENVEINSEYANGKKGYYCLCNNKTDTAENKKFVIYSIDNSGSIQKYLIPTKKFDYPNVQSLDSSVYGSILYADDSIIYVKLITRKIEEKEYYYSQPQVYKIYLKEIVNSISEQPSAAPLQPYPNPTDQTLHWNTATGTAVITDAFGRVLIEVPASAMEADVSGLAVGMYFLTIRNGMESAVRSFVVAR